MPTHFSPKDFIETAEGLLFAVVMHGTEQGKVLCFLRYIKEATRWKKVTTAQANAFLAQHHPQYLYYSPVLNAPLHAVDVAHITQHHQPRQRLQQLMQTTAHDVIEQDAVQLGRLLQQQTVDLTQVGITGSLLIGVQNSQSDIDLVCYNRSVFQQCRTATRELIKQGLLDDLNDDDWQQAYQRRSCALSFVDYVWHERRKANKAMINGRKFDLSFVDIVANVVPKHYQKLGKTTLQCTVINDDYAFDYPAELFVDHNAIHSIVSFTATYNGQAIKGETIEVSGTIEQDDSGNKRLVVGSSREAEDEYIRVLSSDKK